MVMVEATAAVKFTAVESSTVMTSSVRHSAAATVRPPTLAALNEWDQRNYGQWNLYCMQQKQNINYNKLFILYICRSIVPRPSYFAEVENEVLVTTISDGGYLWWDLVSKPRALK